MATPEGLILALRLSKVLNEEIENSKVTLQDVIPAVGTLVVFALQRSNNLDSAPLVMSLISEVTIKGSEFVLNAQEKSPRVAPSRSPESERLDGPISPERNPEVNAALRDIINKIGSGGFK